MSFYLSRINGYALITFILGIVAHYLLAEKVLILAVPMFLCWLASHDIKSFEREQQKRLRRQAKSR
ncbi:MULTISPECIES: hypothetical protein [Vagococcus]|uniref:hypothetical protein n=1 Tax=Vagococcus TaxID=2737 RepID=UPI000E487500|nr:MULTISPECIES: hypothetical protein [Vagococcus]RHH70120.1 hypothetical protein DW196_04980 [Vagococcus sp. AM17-17]